MRKLTISQHSWPLKNPFIISRSTRTETHTITVCIQENDYRGYGEAVASPRYGESQESAITQIRSIETEICSGLTREKLQLLLPAGAARNALDCALWDLEAKLAGVDVGELSGLGWPNKLHTVQTISILSPQKMGQEAERLKDFPIVKVKLNNEMIIERIQAIHANAPDTKLIIDANESWSLDILNDVVADLAKLNVIMIEQPLKADDDDALSNYRGELPIFADESCHTSQDIPDLTGKYHGINIKLDKTGGLTEAILLMRAAKSQQLDIMLGCMLGTSLGIAPASFIAQHAKFVDIDAPALIAQDQEHGFTILNGKVSPLNTLLWGGTKSR